MPTLVDRIKRLAYTKYGWNLKTTAQKAGIGTNSIYRWKSQTPTTESLQKVATVLDTSVDYLLNGAGQSAIKRVVDLDDHDVWFTFEGHHVSANDLEIFKRLLRGSQKK